MVYYEAISNNFAYQFGVREELENGHYVGFPTDGTSENCMDTKGILVIRKGTQRMEEVRDLFASVFDKDVQIRKNFGYYPGVSVMKLADPKITTGEDGKLHCSAVSRKRFGEHHQGRDRNILHGGQKRKGSCGDPSKQGAVILK